MSKAWGKVWVVRYGKARGRGLYVSKVWMAGIDRSHAESSTDQRHAMRISSPLVAVLLAAAVGGRVVRLKERKK